MALSIILLCILYFIYLLHYVVGNSHNYLEGYNILCFTNDSQSLFHTGIVSSFSRTYVITIHNVIAFLYHVFLYISAWEFICSQSPQHMKGLLFAMIYAVRALYRFFAAIFLIIILDFIKSHKISCLFSYYAINFIIGLISLIFFVRVTYKYEYRKRDDICNIPVCGGVLLQNWWRLIFYVWYPVNEYN